MGLSIRIFIVEDDDTIKRLQLACYERLLKLDPDERLSKYAGKRVRYALIVVDLVNRKPIEVVRDEYAHLDFDEEGRFKEPAYEKDVNRITIYLCLACNRITVKILVSILDVI